MDNHVVLDKNGNIIQFPENVSGHLSVIDASIASLDLKLTEG